MAAVYKPAPEYGIRTKPSGLLNSLFMCTVNRAGRLLVTVATGAGNAELADKWRVTDHLRFMFLLMSWVTVWFLRFVMDHLPFNLGPSPYSTLEGFSRIGAFELLQSSPATAVTSGSLYSYDSPSDACLDLVVQEGYKVPSAKALGRALTHILAILNEIPATSRKYQFAVAMADKIVDDNARSGHVELLQINRMALASAFSGTSSLLQRSLLGGQAPVDRRSPLERAVRALPLGWLVSSYFKGIGLCISTVFPFLSREGGVWGGQGRQQAAGGGSGDENYEGVAAEKHAQELLWITNKLMVCGAVDEALFQWSFASELASLSLTANLRVQGFIVKISAILFRELTGESFDVSRQVKFRMLALWIPLFCYAGNGVAYPTLTGSEKAEMESLIDEVISSLPVIDQEIILSNWLQDFTNSASDWPDLQVSYDRWCQSYRKLIV